ncbi:MAG: NYN domain-containing protein [Pseudomonadota bacterium]
MKSALFVDFDNVYSQLRQLQPDAAERFARHPSEWMSWLTGSLALPEPHEEGERRRLLVRRCYLNPNWYQGYRHAFLRAGFEIVDCPPVTSQGKTSTDIHMVLDIVDLLQHETRCDEFIVFSADADFTPVLRKLRRYDRRTTVLAIGFPSAAYQASADLLIDERLFLREALGLGPAAADVPPSQTGQTTEIKESRPAESKPVMLDSKVASPAVTAPKAEPSSKVVSRLATPDELSEIAGRLWTFVDEAPLPVSSGQLASRLRQEFPEVLESWNGLGTFKAFFRSLGLSRLLWLSGSGGRVLDPSRHELEGPMPEQEPESPWAGAEGLFPVIREVCVLTGAPLLAPKDLRTVMIALVRVLQKQEFKLPATVQSVCRYCVELEGLRVRPRDVTFLVRGMQMNGHVFGRGADDEGTLAARLLNQILFLCEREQKVPNQSEIEQIRTWIGAAVVA